MMKHNILFSAFFASSLFAASPMSDEQAIAKGSEVSTALLQKLGGEVKNQMQSGGPIAALQFCSQNALVLTDEIAKASNTSIKRISDKNRNPINALETETDEKYIWHLWQRQIAEGKQLKEYEYKRISEKESVYYKPILINNEACLKCHGNLEADSPVAKAIKSLYPDDKATGYKMGDLRGMIVITIPR